MAEDRWSQEPVPASPGRPARPIRAPRSEPRPELQESLAIVWRRKWSILAITLLCLAVALVLSSRRTPIYESGECW
jgi:LPS O-antigen subunit length determinant protein (WzzB/FepE family)